MTFLIKITGPADQWKAKSSTGPLSVLVVTDLQTSENFEPKASDPSPCADFPGWGLEERHHLSHGVLQLLLGQPDHHQPDAGGPEGTGVR